MFHHPVSGHYIKKNHASVIPRKLLVIDTETKQVVKGKKTFHRFLLGWSVLATIDGKGRVTSEEWKPHSSPYLLNKYIDSSCKRDEILYMAGVNIFFDLQSCDFFYFMTRWGWHQDFVFDKGATYILIISKGRRVIKIVSTTNYWTHSARALGILFGIHKADPDFTSVSQAHLSCYCFRDTEIAFESVIKYLEFIVKNDLGSFRVSRASQSYAAFRHRFMKVKLFAHDDKDIQSIESQAYMGGRVEAYQLGKLKGGPFDCFDVNSMYPFVMKTFPMPIKCCDYMSNPKRTDIEDLLRHYCIVASVELDTDSPIYAVKYQGKTVFPIGRFSAFLCTGALKSAFARGHVKRITRAAIYENAVIFDEYIEFFYGIREKAKSEGDTVWNRASKIFMNALYGKFAQRRPIIESDIDVESEDYSREEIWDSVTRKAYITTTLMNRKITHYGEEPCKGTIISIPAHITEYARLLLWSIIESTGRNRVLYCDTDSILTRSEYSKYIVHPVSKTELGALSHKWQSSTLEIRGCKDYTTDREVIIKGVPKNATMVSPGTYEYTEWPKQRTHLQEKQNRFYVCKRKIKVLSGKYDKGNISASGKVSPFRFPLG